MNARLKNPDGNWVRNGKGMVHLFIDPLYEVFQENSNITKVTLNLDFDTVRPIRIETPLEVAECLDQLILEL